MKVYVKPLKGIRFDIEVQPTDTVLNVKKQIEEIQGAQTYPSEQQQLIYQCKVLKDETTIEENEVSENTLVVMLSKLLKYSDIWELEWQDPPAGKFSSLDLQWLDVEHMRKRDSVDNVSVIPCTRVRNFIKGEGSRGDIRTRFIIASRKKKQEDCPHRCRCKPRADASHEYTTYHCKYGPDDHREGGLVRRSRQCTKQSEKKCPGRPKTKRGCLCCFTVKRLHSKPDKAIIIYNEKEHVDVSRSLSHGPFRPWSFKKKRSARAHQKILEGE